MTLPLWEIQNQAKYFLKERTLWIGEEAIWESRFLLRHAIDF